MAKTKKALVVWGGWSGHDPAGMSRELVEVLTREGFDVDVVEGVEAFDDLDYLKSVDLIVPCVTMGTLTPAQCANVLVAVEGGTGLAGNHGGMCDAFRGCVDWAFLTGGTWVAHPGNMLRYEVKLTEPHGVLTAGLDDFWIESEQYYLHVDPAVRVWATTRFPVADGPHTANGVVDMPVIWTKMWGAGRVFYCSIGHSPAELHDTTAGELMRRGMLWAAGCLEDCER